MFSSKATTCSQPNLSFFKTYQKNDEESKVQELTNLLKSIKRIKSEPCFLYKKGDILASLDKSKTKDQSLQFRKSNSLSVEKLNEASNEVSSLNYTSPLGKPVFGHQSLLLKSKIDALEERLNHIQLENQKIKKSIQHSKPSHIQSSQESNDKNTSNKLLEEIAAIKKQLTLLNIRLSSFESSNVKKDKDKRICEENCTFTNSNPKSTENINESSLLLTSAMKVKKTENGTQFIFQNGDQMMRTNDNIFVINTDLSLNDTNILFLFITLDL